MSFSLGIVAFYCTVSQCIYIIIQSLEGVVVVMLLDMVKEVCFIGSDLCRMGILVIVTDNSEVILNYNLS